MWHLTGLPGYEWASLVGGYPRWVGPKARVILLESTEVTGRYGSPTGLTSGYPQAD